MTFDGESPMAELRAENGREKPWKVKYLRRRQRELGLRRQHAAGILRGSSIAATRPMSATTATTRFTGSPAGRTLMTINWTEVLMREAARYMDGLTLHYYTVPVRLGDERLGDGFRPKTNGSQTLAQGARHGRADHQAHHDHGQIRSRESASA